MVGLMFEAELLKRWSLLLRKHRWKNRPQPRRERQQLGSFGENEGEGVTEEKGDWFRVMRRGRRLLLKHLNASESAASQGLPVVGNRKLASKRRRLSGSHELLNAQMFYQ